MREGGDAVQEADHSNGRPFWSIRQAIPADLLPIRDRWCASYPVREAGRLCLHLLLSFVTCLHARRWKILVTTGPSFELRAPLKSSCSRRAASLGCSSRTGERGVRFCSSFRFFSHERAGRARGSKPSSSSRCNSPLDVPDTPNAHAL